MTRLREGGDPSDQRLAGVLLLAVAAALAVALTWLAAGCG